MTAALSAVRGWIRAAWKWLADNPIALAAMLGAVVGAFLMWKSSRNRIESLEEAVEVQAHRRKIAAAETEAKMLEASADAKEPKVEALKAEIARSKRRVVELSKGERLEGKTDEEIADLFTRAGF